MLAALTLTAPFARGASGVVTSSRIATGDISGDGIPDIVICSQDLNKPIQVLIADGQGNWLEGPDLGLEFSGYRLAALVDLDGDGDLDIVLSNPQSVPEGWKPIQILFRTGSITPGQTGAFTIGPQIGPDVSALGAQYSRVGVAFGQFDTNPGLDMLVLVGFEDWENDGSPELANQIWTNDGAGNFSDTGQRLGDKGWYDVALGDIDGDGDLDFLVLNTLADSSLVEGGRGQVWKNNGSGVFTLGQDLPTFSSQRDTDVALADLNGDLHLDAYIINHYDEFGRVYLNDGSGQLNYTRFNDVEPNPGAQYDLVVADMDGDGDLDVVVGMTVDTPTTIFLNNGNAVFAAGIPTTLTNAAAIAVADFNADGKPDIVGLDATYIPGQQTPLIHTWLNNLSAQGSAPVITSALTAAGEVGTAFSYAITATNSPTSFNATGLPAGLTINTATGIIAGTPTATGATTVSISASNTNGIDTRSLVVTIVFPAPVITSPLTASGIVGTAFSYTITAANNPTYFDAVGLPAGLYVDTATGIIAGTPTASGTTTVAISASSGNGRDAKPLVVTIAPASPITPVITSPLTTSGAMQVAFSYTITATNTPTSFDAAGLPAGLTIDTATGIISGTPTQSGQTAVAISASNASGTNTESLLVSIALSPFAPVITSPLTASATVGVAFSYTITATNSPTSFDATGMPAGLSIDTSTGVISGTPTSSVNAHVIVSATNASGSGSQTLAVAIWTPPSPLIEITSPSDGAVFPSSAYLYVNASYSGDQTDLVGVKIYAGSFLACDALPHPTLQDPNNYRGVPFSLSDGAHALTAVAVFLDGHTLASAAVNIVMDSRAPIFVSPGYGSIVTQADPVLQVEFSNGTPAPLTVNFYNATNNQLLHTSVSAPYSYDWHSPAVGLNRVYAEATFPGDPVPVRSLENRFFVYDGLIGILVCVLEFLDNNAVSFSHHDDSTTSRSSPPGKVGTSSLHILAQTAGVDLDLFRRFRDEVLTSTAAGRYYTDLYERTSPDLILAVTEDPALGGQIRDALDEWTPAIQALVDGQGGTVQITPEMANQALTILVLLRSIASDDLADYMDKETQALDPRTWSGRTIADLLGRVEAQVRPPPDITTQPVAQAVTAGGTVTLTVAADGAGPFSYQWYRDGVAITGATNETYTVASAQSYDAGDYTVTVSNPFGDTASDTATFAVDAAPANNARLLNLSTRAQTLTGDNILIPGFVVSGTGTKKLLIRAVGPTLSHAPFNIATALDNPKMALKRLDFSQNPAAYVDVDANDDWMTNANSAAISQAISDLYAFPFEDDREAALLVDLAPGQYTVFADGVNAATGIAIVELYDADAGSPTAKLINISNRGYCGVGSDVMIPGFVISSEGAKTLLIRVVGPTLAGAPFNVPGTMADPKLEIFPAGSATPILTQDNWGDNPDAATTTQVASDVSAFALADGSADAAFVVTLPPGSYTVVGSAADGTSTGVVLVEIYVVP